MFLVFLFCVGLFPCFLSVATLWHANSCAGWGWCNCSPIFISWNGSNTDIAAVGHKCDSCFLRMTDLFSAVRCATKKQKKSCTENLYQCSGASLAPVIRTGDIGCFISYIVSVLGCNYSWLSYDNLNQPLYILATRDVIIFLFLTDCTQLQKTSDRRLSQVNPASARCCVLIGWNVARHSLLACHQWSICPCHRCQESGLLLRQTFLHPG